MQSITDADFRSIDMTWTGLSMRRRATSRRSLWAVSTEGLVRVPFAGQVSTGCLAPLAHDREERHFVISMHQPYRLVGFWQFRQAGALVIGTDLDREHPVAFDRNGVGNDGELA